MGHGICFKHLFLSLSFDTELGSTFSSYFFFIAFIAVHIINFYTHFNDFDFKSAI